jgi:hypothetical protein
MKKQEVISKVNESLGSLFTKDDVVKVIDMLDEGGAQDSERMYSRDQVERMINDLAANIRENFENIDSTDIVSEDDIELSLSGMHLEIDSIDVNTRPMYEAIESARCNFDIDDYNE